MKKPKIASAALALAVLSIAPYSFAQLAIPSDGSDGALIINGGTNVIDLSQAVTGTWSDNNSANAGKGIYDPNKWAVVFKYSSVTIASNATVTFKNHITHAPVVWLVGGDVTINGTLSLNGINGSIQDPVNLSEPGPGGFRGGAMDQSNLGHGSGFGPGGYYNDYGGYSDYHAYGNLQILPLIGGSGGSGGAANCFTANGGGGGGAILVAAAGTATVNGNIQADGGRYTGCGAWGGSGGAVRLVANQIIGSGRIEAIGDHPGRVRLEATATSASLSTDPLVSAVSPDPLVIWPAADAPTASVISIGGQVAPADPKAIMSGSNGADDVTIATNSAVTILVQTQNFPTNGTVNVFVKPRNAPQSIYTASLVNGTPQLATWQVVQPPPVGHFVVQVRAFSN
ncbi:MAG TPA: hypothetical protein VHH88_07435 [Verrucomicrobiae bacterium]|nr:hypothetical protein [Verrucomicrobiae bacterium]